MADRFIEQSKEIANNLYKILFLLMTKHIRMI